MQITTILINEKIPNNLNQHTAEQTNQNRKQKKLIKQRTMTAEHYANINMK